MTKIEWADEVWNPVTGCSKVSDGCQNCYAEKMSHRFKWTEMSWNEKNSDQNIKLHPERLELPSKWKKPRRVFVNSMSDLFHENVPFQFIEMVFGVMEEAWMHTFQVLTKRPQRMLDFMRWYSQRSSDDIVGLEWSPPENVWLGVSVENQKAADQRIPLLLETPAAVRFLSCEPLLGPVDLKEWIYPGWDGDIRKTIPAPRVTWVIVGGESGPKARPMHPEWARNIRDQCVEAGVPFFFKQWGEWAPKDSGLSAKNMIHFHTSGKLYDPKKPEEWYAKGFETVYRVGKKKAGRLLDGLEWNEMPVS